MEKGWKDAGFSHAVSGTSTSCRSVHSHLLKLVFNADGFCTKLRHEPGNVCAPVIWLTLKDEKLGPKTSGESFETGKVSLFPDRIFFRLLVRRFGSLVESTAWSGKVKCHWGLISRRKRPCFNPPAGGLADDLDPLLKSFDRKDADGCRSASVNRVKHKSTVRKNLQP